MILRIVFFLMKPVIYVFGPICQWLLYRNYRANCDRLGIQAKSLRDWRDGVLDDMRQRRSL